MFSIIIAQGIDNVKSGTIKDLVIIIGFSVIVLGSLSAWLTYLYVKRKDAEKAAREPRAPGARMPNVRRDMCDFKMGDVSRRLDDHARQIGEIWEEMRAEDQKTRERLDASFQSIQRSLGKIEGKLEEITDK